MSLLGQCILLKHCDITICIDETILNNKLNQFTCPKCDSPIAIEWEGIWYLVGDPIMKRKKVKI